MDNMRHLSTSLPRARRTPPQELLSDFKAAALSVTNLYKAAANASTQARAAGYQDALEDLLTLMDSENIGVMDGEGWRVRQWATSRLDEGSQRQPSDDDEETGREGLDTRSSSPEAQRKPPVPSHTPNITESTIVSSPQGRTASEPPSGAATQSQIQTQAPTTGSTVRPPPTEFTFTARPHFPEKDSGMELETSTPGTAPYSGDTLRVLPRPSRHRLNTNHRSRAENRSTLNFNLGAGAGNKRKIPYQDFFDISDINFEPQDKKDGNGRGGKRGRFV